MLMMIIIAIVAIAAFALIVGVGGSVLLFSVGGIGIFIKFLFSIIMFFLGIGLKILLPIFLVALVIYLIMNRK